MLSRSLIYSFFAFLGLVSSVYCLEEVDSQNLPESLKRFRNLKVLKAGFNQEKTLPDLNFTLKSEGNLEIRRPSYVRWQILKPSNVEVILEDNSVSIRSGAKESQTTTSLPETKAMHHLLVWLELDIEKLFAAYRVFKASEQEFVFRPKENTIPFSELSMKLSNEGHLKSLRLNERSGDVIRITFDRPSKISWK